MYGTIHTAQSRFTPSIFKCIRVYAVGDDKVNVRDKALVKAKRTLTEGTGDVNQKRAKWALSLGTGDMNQKRAKRASSLGTGDMNQKRAN